MPKDEEETVDGLWLVVFIIDGDVLTGIDVEMSTIGFSSLSNDQEDDDDTEMSEDVDALDKVEDSDDSEALADDCFCTKSDGGDGIGTDKGDSAACSMT